MTYTEYPFFVTDFHADSLYIFVTDIATPVARTRSITPSINADMDADGNVVGIEFLSLQMDFGEEFKLRRVEP